MHRFCGIQITKRCASALETRRRRTHIINTVLFRKYQILSLLGSGGSSSVYLAEHLKLKQYRAIKCIPKTQVQAASWYQEADLLKNLRHPGIPMIYDVEEDETNLYLIEEYIRGESLSAYVQNSDNISQETIIAFGIQLCEILEYLHQQKPHPILYLDLKPEHIILCGNQLKLIDFGISTIVKDKGNLYQSCGTHGFAAPEQFCGREIGIQTDVYGIGAVLYYMLTEDILPPSGNVSFPKYCSFRFKKIILKAVSPRQTDRFGQAVQLRTALEKISLGPAGKPAAAHLLEKILVVGSQAHIGTTHIAISLVSWLNRKKATAYYQAEGSNDFLSKLLAYQKGAAQEGGILTYRQFQAVTEPDEEAEAKKSHIYVQDLGTDVASASEEEYSFVVLVVGGRPWEIEQGISACQKLAGEENLVLLCNYNQKQAAGIYASILQKKVFYFPLDQNPFDVTRDKHRLFQQISREGRRERFGSKA